MLIPDPNNHNKDYLFSLECLDFDGLSIDFYDKYQRKIDSFENKIENIIDPLYNYDYTKSPEAILSSSDKAYKYLNEKVKPFFIQMQEHYGINIMEYYDDLENEIINAKTDYLNNDYEAHRKEYEIFLIEQKHIKNIKSAVLKALKEKSPIKQVDLIRQFNTEDATLIKKYIQELCISGKILKARNTTSGKGTIFLVYLQNIQNQ